MSVKKINKQDKNLLSSTQRMKAQRLVIHAGMMVIVLCGCEFDIAQHKPFHQQQRACIAIRRTFASLKTIEQKKPSRGSIQVRVSLSLRMWRIASANPPYGLRVKGF